MDAMPDTFDGLFWIYLVVWGLLVLYIAWLGIRVGRLERKNSKED